MAYVQTAVTLDSTLALACHDIMHAVGVLAGELTFPEYGPDSCQYGYLHGVLQARAKAGGRHFVSSASAWCAGIVHNDARFDSECLHGIGHGVAISTRGDLAASLRLCATLEYPRSEPCANGVMMENVAIDRQDGPFFMSDADESGQAGELKLTTGEIEVLCPEAPKATRLPCYRLVWSLLYERYGDDVERAIKVCERASDEPERRACWLGFSTYAIELTEARSLISWPPKSSAEARKYAEVFLAECRRHQDIATCVEGGSYTTHAGAYVADLADGLVPPICENSGTWREACRRGKERAKTMVDGVK